MTQAGTAFDTDPLDTSHPDAERPCVKAHDWAWMQRALALAEWAQSQGEVPVGAVLVDDRQQEVACGWNQTITLHDPSAHAEIMALRRAGQALGNHRLTDLTLYVTLEPCPMCAGALVHARVKRMVVATPDPRTGCAGSLLNLTRHPELNHHIDTCFGVEKAQAQALLQSFFQAKRARKKRAQKKPSPSPN